MINGTCRITITRHWHGQVKRCTSNMVWQHGLANHFRGPQTTDGPARSPGAIHLGLITNSVNGFCRSNSNNVSVSPTSRRR